MRVRAGTTRRRPDLLSLLRNMNCHSPVDTGRWSCGPSSWSWSDDASWLTNRPVAVAVDFVTRFVRCRRACTIDGINSARCRRRKQCDRTRQKVAKPDWRSLQLPVPEQHQLQHRPEQGHAGYPQRSTGDSNPYQFRRARNRSITFGITTTVLPLVLGTGVGLAFGYATIPAIVIGSLLASHTLLGLPVLDKLGLKGLEPVTVTVGATVMADTLSLVVFAICVSIYTTGFSPSALTLLLAEIAGYIVLVLFGLSRVAAYVLKRVEDEEDAYFVLMLCIMAIAGVLADAIQLPGIVGAFLAGLAVNASAHDKPASAKLEFLSKSLFIPIFFIVTGFLINPVAFVYGIFDNYLLVAGIIAALLIGKWIAAWVVGRAFDYSRDEQLTVWSLTLPQVAATLAATWSPTIRWARPVSACSTIDAQRGPRAGARHVNPGAGAHGALRPRLVATAPRRTAPRAA